MRLACVVGLVVLSACAEPTAPARCTQPDDFTWQWMRLYNADSTQVDSLQIGWCVR